MKNTLSPIASAVAPLLEKAVERAESETRLALDKAYARLAAADWNVNAIAPRPSSNMDRKSYREALAKHDFYVGITTADEVRNRGLYRRNDPEYRVENRDRAETIVKNARDAAAAGYWAYVAKLEAKIGEVVEASLTTNGGVWSDSTLSVTKADGSSERWNTKVIINQSVYGLLFNQWPTRKVK